MGDWLAVTVYVSAAKRSYNLSSFHDWWFVVIARIEISSTNPKTRRKVLSENDFSAINTEEKQKETITFLFTVFSQEMSERCHSCIEKYKITRLFTQNNLRFYLNDLLHKSNNTYKQTLLQITNILREPATTTKINWTNFTNIPRNSQYV